MKSGFSPYEMKHIMALFHTDYTIFLCYFTTHFDTKRVRFW